jgi:phenylalanyl-tRNA synthetase beta chain
MKFSVNWLKQWVSLEMGPQELAASLTAAGLEVDSVEPVAAEFSAVVVAEIASCVPHPSADRLSVCSVNDGSGQSLQVVCGAPNARAGLRVPLARVGARIGPDLNIKAAKLRGVESAGMLCSAQELGLSDDHSGLLELPADAPLGEDLRHYLSLDDCSIEVDLTPNRADCLSIRGLARDVSAICAAGPVFGEIRAVAAQSEESIPIRLASPEDCPRYAGRIIRGIDPGAKTPLWMREALRRCGVRSISPVVDVTNYVLLELGQPMHAFDLSTLDREIVVRRGRSGEQLQLLDGTDIELDDEVLAICDAAGPVALAGIMGGAASAVTGATQHILLESAWFRPATIMGKARSYGLHTDASHRFERGVDPQGQVEAVEHATRLILEICGGVPGPVLVAEQVAHIPVNQPVRLRHERLNRLVGMEFAPAKVEDILSRLGMQITAGKGDWTVTAPSARMDIAREEDLIEEIARIYGYDHIPEAAPSGKLSAGSTASHDVPLEQLQASLCAAGYQEVINYSFVDRRHLEAVHQAEYVLPLANPLSAEMDVMRTTLLPGLLLALNHNARRQQDRVRLYETGLAYLQNGSLREIPRIGAVAMGSAWPEQWSAPARALDFFDIKGEVERLLSFAGNEQAVFTPAEHAWIQPGASARVALGGQVIGWCGAVHPAVLRALDVEGPVFAFELDLEPLQKREVPFVKPISRFPSIRRDLAIWVPEQVAYQDIRTEVEAAAGALLQKLVVFDVYQDVELKKGYKSVAIGLILQHVSSNLTGEAVDLLIARVVAALEQALGAYLRG